MLATWKRRLAGELAETLRRLYGVDHAPVAEIPPRRALGDLAFPAALHLARTLSRKPREIAAEVAAAWTLPPGVRELRVEGPGYLNVFFDRPAFTARLLGEEVIPAAESASLCIGAVTIAEISPARASAIPRLM